MSSSIVAKRYAKALLESVESDELLDPVKEELSEIAGLFEEEKVLKTYVLGSITSTEDKLKFLNRLLEKLDVHEMMKKFIILLLKNDRLDILREIHSAFSNLLDEKRNIMRINLTSAHELREKHKDKIINTLSEMTGKKIKLDCKVNEELIGGFILEIDGKVYNTSLLRQMELMKKRLLSN